MEEEEEQPVSKAAAAAAAGGSSSCCFGMGTNEGDGGAIEIKRGKRKRRGKLEDKVVSNVINCDPTLLLLRTTLLLLLSTIDKVGLKISGQNHSVDQQEKSNSSE